VCVCRRGGGLESILAQRGKDELIDRCARPFAPFTSGGIGFCSGRKDHQLVSSCAAPTGSAEKAQRSIQIVHTGRWSFGFIRLRIQSCQRRAVFSMRDEARRFRMDFSETDFNAKARRRRDAKKTNNA
jgi:hypothetical protein